MLQGKGAIGVHMKSEEPNNLAKPFFPALIFLAGLLAGCNASRNAKFEEITVQRIKLVEPDGTLRMVISDHAKFPGIIVRGKEQAYERPQAGVLFYNDEGSENGGLIFGGHRNANGEIVDSGGSLTFDKYDANQIVQLAGVDDKDDKFAGLMVGDSKPEGDSPTRIWVGRKDDGTATVALMDGNGRKRLVLEVPESGAARISFLDADGKVLSELVPTKTK
jgi:hypothetical protein